jgi:hypothetical protein
MRPAPQASAAIPRPTSKSDKAVGSGTAVAPASTLGAENKSESEKLNPSVAATDSSESSMFSAVDKFAS